MIYEGNISILGGRCSIFFIVGVNSQNCLKTTLLYSALVVGPVSTVWPGLPRPFAL